MTLVGMQYLSHQETVRSNKARERETERSNRTDEQIRIDDRLSREGIASADRRSREKVSRLDRYSREKIAEADRLSKEGIAESDRTAKLDMNSANIASNQYIAEMQDKTRRDEAAGKFEVMAGSYGTAAQRMDPSISDAGAAVLQTIGGVDKVAQYAESANKVFGSTGKNQTTKSTQSQQTRPLTQGQESVTYDRKGNVTGRQVTTYQYGIPKQ